MGLDGPGVLDCYSERFRWQREFMINRSFARQQNGYNLQLIHISAPILSTMAKTPRCFQKPRYTIAQETTVEIRAWMNDYITQKDRYPYTNLNPSRWVKGFQVYKWFDRKAKASVIILWYFLISTKLSICNMYLYWPFQVTDTHIYFSWVYLV